MSTVKPLPDQVADSGAGRVDIGRPTTQQAYATPAPLNFDSVRFAPDGTYQPVTKQATIHNGAFAARTFTVSGGSP